jgi:predicted ATP-dependent endonuclease of OLD family
MKLKKKVKTGRIFVYIQTIKISNFRSFAEEVIIEKLNRVNIFIGKNAAGKTNILEILRLINGLAQRIRYRPIVDCISFTTNDPNKDQISIELEFFLEEEEREELIQELFKNNITKLQPEKVLKSSFLKAISHRLKFSTRGVEEEILGTTNFSGKKLVVWEQVLHERDLITARGSDLPGVCKRIKRIDDLTLPLKNRVQGGKLSWLCFWSVTNSDILAQIIKKFYLNIEWIPPNREPQKQMNVQESRSLDSSCSNVPQVWHTIVSDEPQDLVRIGANMTKVASMITSISAPIRSNQTIAYIKENTGHKFDLSNTSSGLRQVAMLVTKIDTCPKDQVMLIEEPELHLHATAQRGLREYINSLSNVQQFFITTHSTIFTNMNLNCSVYLVTKRGIQSNIRRIIEIEEQRIIKRELGHSYADLYGYDLIVFIEGDSEDRAIPIIAESLGIDLVKYGIKLINIRGKDKAIRLDQYLEYQRDSDVIPFIILDGDKKIKNKLKDWERSNILPKGNYRMWKMEFEDLFSLKLIAECCSELEYRGITVEKLEEMKGERSVVHAINRILYENDQRGLEKPALAELLAEKVTVTKKDPYDQLKNVIERIIDLLKSKNTG